jgi:hypothetical protein
MNIDKAKLSTTTNIATTTTVKQHEGDRLEAKKAADKQTDFDRIQEAKRLGSRVGTNINTTA